MISKRQVVEGVEVVTGSLRSGVTVTATIVSSGRKAVVFDTLMWPEDTAGLVQGLKVEGRKVMALVDTHWHVDHVAGNQLFTSTVLGQSMCPELMRIRLPEQLKGTLGLIVSVLACPRECLRSGWCCRWETVGSCCCICPGILLTRWWDC